jgi:hypothetical protein
MLKLLSIVLLAAMQTVAYADLFKWVDENGEVIYSDQPPPVSENQEKFLLDEDKLPALINTPAQKVPTSPQASKDKQEENQIQSVSITFPEHDTAVRSNNGTLNIQLAVNPALDANSREILIVLMDGEEVYRGKSSQVTLYEVDRGTHLLEAKMLSADGQVISSSEVISFTLQRYSALF